jgi:glycosyltransferase involved in cell wall biosynthesis
MIRVLTLSKPYVASAYRNKLTELASLPDIASGLIAPYAWGNQKWEDSGSNREQTLWTRRLNIHLNGKNHFHFYRGLEKAVREFKPDIFNIEEEHYSVVTFQACRIARKLGAIPVFYTWQNIYKDYPPPFRWIEQYVFRCCPASVTGNSEATDVLRRKGYRGIIRQIPQMGVEIERFTPDDLSELTRQGMKAKLGLDPNAFWVMFAGRLVEEKGVQDLLRALELIATSQAKVISPARTNHRSTVKALVLGGGPYAAQLQLQAKDLIAVDRVRFMDAVPSRDVALYLQACDVLCLPSLTRSNWKEQFGRILVEAMAAGAICIGSSSGEIPVVIGDVGLVFPEGDVPALADAIQKIAGDVEKRSHLREAAMARVNDCYSNRVVAEEFARLFRELKRQDNQKNFANN